MNRCPTYDLLVEMNFVASIIAGKKRVSYIKTYIIWLVKTSLPEK
jgi:hypothetical protein